MISIVKKYLILTLHRKPLVILLVLMMGLATFSEAAITKITTEIPPCTIPVTGQDQTLTCGGSTNVTLYATTIGTSYGSNITHYWYSASSGGTLLATRTAQAVPPAPNTQAYTSSYVVSSITSTTSYWIATCTDGTRDELKVTVNTAPTASITTNGDSPVDVCPGSGFTISSTTTSSSYQWYKNGAAISGATSQDYSPTTDGGYKVTISTSCGASTSTTVAVNFTPLLTNTASISGDNTICLGNLATFTATRNASLLLSEVDYQWKVNGVNVGTDSPTFASSSLANGQNITCTITINNGTTCASPTSVTSNSMTMVVTDPNTIPLLLVDKILNCGSETVNLYATTSSTAYTGLQHYWYDNQTGGTPIVKTPTVLGEYPGAVTSSLSITPPTSTSYWVSAVHNGCESSPRKELVVTVNSLPVVGITTDGVSPVDVCSLDNFYIRCTTTGSSYQWYNGTTLISGATSLNYFPTTNGSYKVKIIDATCGELTSTATTVSFIPLITNTASISSDKGNAICLGEVTTFTATRNASLLLSEVDYQWKLDGVNVGTNSTTFASSSLTNGQNVTCTITINNGTTCATPTSVTSNTITMVVTDPNTIPLLLVDKILNCGSETVNLYATTASTAYTGLQHHWYTNETGGTATALTPTILGEYPGAVTSSLTFTPSTTTSYWVSAVLNGCESSPRKELVVTVNSSPIVEITTHGVSPYDVCTEDNFYISCTTVSSSYQWYKNGVAITGATTADYYPTTTGDYTVKSIDATCGELTSGITPVTVVDYTATPIISPPDSLTIASDLDQLISVNLTGLGYTYQWKNNGVNIAGETNATYLANTDGRYTVDVLYGGCVKTSGALDLHINLLPIPIFGSDIDLKLAYGLNVILDGSASYDPDGTIVSYSWSEVSNKNVLIEAGNTDIPTLSNITEAGTYEFRLSVVDDFGESASDNIIITASMPPNNYNWVKATTVLTKDVKNAADVIANEKSIQWDYFDGLGRPMQSVSVGSSPTGKDIVQPMLYDEFGRERKQYLPYVSNTTADGYYKTTAIDPDIYSNSDQYQFYQATEDKIINDIRPFSEVIIEPSPLNRVIQQYGAGEDWNNGVDIDRPVRYNYEVNALDEVLFWVVSENMPISETPNEYYDPGELFKNITIDEENHEVITFVDKQGRTILKRIQAPDDGNPNTDDWADTYYVYDDFGNLRFVLPPEATRLLTE